MSRNEKSSRSLASLAGKVLSGEKKLAQGTNDAGTQTA